MWERLFDEGYRADVIIHTDKGRSIYSHARILQAKGSSRQRSISIQSVPHDAIRVFIRFLYSSCNEKEEMEEFVLHLLVLSHVFVVPDLKKICVHKLEQGFLTTESVVDIFQLALLCDAPRLSLICHRMILTNFQEISTTQGWQAMKQSHPVLEKELLESMVDAMEALVHICRDGCRTFGPQDKDIRETYAPCPYSACKVLELLIRHFAGCKLRIPGGCIHCKRLWQLLELHSLLCADSNVCRVPLCKYAYTKFVIFTNFKDRIRRQSKKDEVKWRILEKKILRTKRIENRHSFHRQFPHLLDKKTM
ncbi:hypothetical protein P3X46_012591 [Hevea brasiliensis]|uniref:TAZ-type domain-containing protein n=1 Tax=Hevea brasiliensis TaxID=3981 RepID=A0ABQ9MAQ3_HEVBR|nr:hypothetical protein P3X46_012591 [Hevea brasiliensis]